MYHDVSAGIMIPYGMPACCFESAVSAHKSQLTARPNISPPLLEKLDHKQAVKDQGSTRCQKCAESVHMCRLHAAQHLLTHAKGCCIFDIIFVCTLVDAIFERSHDVIARDDVNTMQMDSKLPQ